MKRKQATSNLCFVCGRENAFGLHLDFYRDDSGEVTAEYTAPEEYQGYPGVVHGGIVGAMLDEVIGRVFMKEGPPRFMMTAKLAIRYRKPVPIGKPLKLFGYPGKDNGRIATASGEIRDEAGSILATAEGIYVNIPEPMLSETDFESLGWRVISDEESA